MDLEAAVKTNLNGVNTLTLRVSDLKESFAALLDRLDSLPIDQALDNIDTINQKLKINSQRIANIRSVDFEKSISLLKKEIESIDSKINKLIASASENSKNLGVQQDKLVELQVSIAENATNIETNVIDIKVNGFKNKDTLNSVETVAENQIASDKKVSKIDKRLIDTDQVVDGCIIGIDRNTTALDNLGKTVIITAKVLVDVDARIKNNQTKIAKNTENVELNSIQTKTNAINIRKK